MMLLDIVSCCLSLRFFLHKNLLKRTVQVQKSQGVEITIRREDDY